MLKRPMRGSDCNYNFKTSLASMNTQHIWTTSDKFSIKQCIFWPIHAQFNVHFQKSSVNTFCIQNVFTYRKPIAPQDNHVKRTNFTSCFPRHTTLLVQCPLVANTIFPLGYIYILVVLFIIVERKVLVVLLVLLLLLYVLISVEILVLVV